MNENDAKRIMESPYRKIAAAEEQQELDYLLTVYRALYKNKYRTEPIFPHDSGHIRHIKELRRLVGAKAQELLEYFFSMKDDWFSTQAYSLDCLLKNISKVNASYSAASRLKAPPSGLAIEFYCDACWEPFVLSVPQHFDFDKIIRCETCAQSDRPPKRIAKSERKAAIKTLGSAFKDVP